MTKQVVYQHKHLPEKALVTSRKGDWVEFYREDAKVLSYLESRVFEEAYQEFLPLDKPLYTSKDLREQRDVTRNQGILVPKEFR